VRRIASHRWTVAGAALLRAQASVGLRDDLALLLVESCPSDVAEEAA
jgi:hypothetical protein